MATTTTITEHCGAVWTINKTEIRPTHHERAYWVQKVGGPASIAKPGVVGFYSPTFDAACHALSN